MEAARDGRRVAQVAADDDRVAARDVRVLAGRGADRRARGDDARDHETASGRTIRPLQELRAPAAAGPWPSAQPHFAAVAGTGLFSAYVTNFFAGKYGWYRLLLAFGLREPLENAQRRLTKYGLSAIFTTYWQANLASCISTAAGILQFPAPRFIVLSFIAEAMWVTFWAALIFFLGPAALSLAGFRMVLLLILIWIALRLIYRWKFEKGQQRATG